MAPRVLRRPSAKARLRPRSRARPRRVSMLLVDTGVNEGGCNNVFIDCRSQGLITLDTSRIVTDTQSPLLGGRKAVYKVVVEPYSDERRSATGVSGIMVSAAYESWISRVGYRIMCSLTGFAG